MKEKNLLIQESKAISITLPPPPRRLNKKILAEENKIKWSKGPTIGSPHPEPPTMHTATRIAA